MKDVTLVLQGRVGREQMELWKKNYKDWNVIVSTWEDVDFDFQNSVFSKWLPKKWKLILNKYPLVRFRPQSNLDYQLITTYAGLSEVKTKYVIKARCDEYWSNLDKVYELIKRDEEKIVSSSMYFRSKEYDGRKMRFHIGDKILGATIENLLLMFESTLHNLELNLWDTPNPEGQLGLGYVVAKEKDFNIDYFLQDYKQIRDHRGTESIAKETLINGLYIINEKSMQVALNHVSKNKINWQDAFNEVKYVWDISNDILNKIEDYIQPDGEFDDMSYLKKWFQIIDINELKPYIATYSGGDNSKTRKWFRDDFDNDEEKCLTEL
jgi:hypothetical protein